MKSNKYDYYDCDDCKNKCTRKGYINSDCLLCMRAYGVYDQKTNLEMADTYKNFPKKDLFEPTDELLDKLKAEEDN